MDISDLNNWLVGIFGSLSDGKSTAAAIIILLLTTAIAIIAKAAALFREILVESIKSYRERRAALIRFYTFSKIRLRNCEHVFSAARRSALLAMLRPGMRMYVVAGPPSDDYGTIARYEKHLPYRLQVSIRLMTEYDQMLLAQYEKIGTEEFGKLALSRKRAALENLFDAADDVLHVSKIVISGLEKIGYLSALKAQLDHQLNKLERP